MAELFEIVGAAQDVAMAAAADHEAGHHPAAAHIDDSGAVLIGGEAVGKLDGFRFTPDPRAEGVHGRTLRAAAIKALEGEFSARAQRLMAEDDTKFTIRPLPLGGFVRIKGMMPEEDGSETLVPNGFYSKSPARRSSFRASVTSSTRFRPARSRTPPR